MCLLDDSVYFSERLCQCNLVLMVSFRNLHMKYSETSIRQMR